MARPWSARPWSARPWIALALLACAQARAGLPAPQSASTPAPAPAAAEAAEGPRPDERRPARPMTLQLGPWPVQLTGSWEADSEWRRNFDLTRARHRDRLVHGHELQLEARLRPRPDTEAFVQLVALADSRRTEGSAGVQRSRRLERGQTWLQWTPEAAGWSLQAGRIALAERRAWWWDADLDALRLRARAGPWQIDTGLARELAALSADDPGIAADQQQVLRWFGQASWQPLPRQRIDLFWLRQHDGSPAPVPGSQVDDGDRSDASDLRATWLGLRGSGDWRAGDRVAGAAWRLAWWADLAWLRGRERLTDWSERDDGRFEAGGSRWRRVHGHALDVGATLRLPALGQLPPLPGFTQRATALVPTLTLAHAQGSAPRRAGDGGFRQTGLQENKARLGGVKRWRRYGELLSPELANLVVSSAGLGLRVLDNSAVELLLHRHRQHVASPVVAGSRLGVAPLGRSRQLGHEIDLLLALREWPQLEFTLVLARFRPGSAFAASRRDPAHAVELGITVNF